MRHLPTESINQSITITPLVGRVSRPGAGGKRGEGGMGGTGITLNHHSPAGRPRTRLSSARPPCCRTRNPQWEGVLILNTA